MKVLILCAGLGSRLASLTKQKPKCLVKLNSTSILQRLLDQLVEYGLQRENVFLGCGYKSELLPKGYKKFKNLEFRTTNMMKTTIIGIEGVMLFIEENENLLIIYGDCIYSNSFIKDLILKVDKLSEITIPVDLDWETKWSERYENIYEGTFIRNILRINNIVENIKNIASMINNSDLLKKLENLDSILIRDQVTTESLYILK